MPVAALPPNRITFDWMPWWRCAVCGREWEPPEDPTVYTEASIAAGDALEPICDFCVEEHDPKLFVRLLAKRREFMAN